MKVQANPSNIQFGGVPPEGRQALRERPARSWSSPPAILEELVVGDDRTSQKIDLSDIVGVLRQDPCFEEILAAHRKLIGICG